MADLRGDRYIEASPLGLELYEGVAALPIVSPHGHIDVRLLADPNARLEPPGRLFVTTDHYVVRMLYSQGIPLERAGLRPLDGSGAEVDDRAVWQLLADNLHLFALAPTGLWLRETLATVFGIEEDLDSDSAPAIYARIEERLASPAFAPSALLDRFRVECLATTDAAGSSLAEHRALAESQPGRIRPTFRPDAVVALDAPGWRDALAELDVADYASFVEALAERRAAFKALGATATDHAATSADTTRLAVGEASALFERALVGTVTHADARRFEAHMLNEFARMSCDDGLVMQLHVGSLRDHNGPLAERVRARHRRRHPGRDRLDARPAPAARGVRQRSAAHRHPLHARREHLQPRARAARRPLSGRPARLSVVVPRQPVGHRALPRPGDRDRRHLQPRRLRRRRPRPDGAPRAARPLAPPHVRLARPQGRRRLPRGSRRAPAGARARLRPRAPRVPAGLDAAGGAEAAVDGAPPR